MCPLDFFLLALPFGTRSRHKAPSKADDGLISAGIYISISGGLGERIRRNGSTLHYYSTFGFAYIMAGLEVRVAVQRNVQHRTRWVRFFQYYSSAYQIPRARDMVVLYECIFERKIRNSLLYFAINQVRYGIIQKVLLLYFVFTCRYIFLSTQIIIISIQCTKNRMCRICQFDSNNCKVTVRVTGK